MRTRGPACAAAQPDFLATSYRFPFLHFEFGQMEVERKESLAMVDYDAVAFVIEEARQQHRPLIHGRDGGSAGNAIIEAEMWALRLAVENSLRAEDVGNGGIGGGGEFAVPLTVWSNAAQVIL